MLDGGADLGAGGIGALALRREWLSRCLAVVALRDPPGARNSPLVLLAAVGGIRPDRAAGVGRVDQARQLSAIVAGGMTGGPGPDEPVTLVDADMRFVAEDRRGDLGYQFAVRALLAPPPLQRPARVTVLLGQPRRLGGPSFGMPPSLTRARSSSVMRWRGAAMILASTI